MTNLVIEARGGVIQEVYCDDPRILVVLVNWDELESSETVAKAGVAWTSCVPLRDLPDDARYQFQQAVAGESKEPRVLGT